MKTITQVSQTTLDAYAQLGPWKDQDSAGLVLALVDAIASAADVTERFTRDDVIVPYDVAVLADQPIGFWKLNEVLGSTSVVDYSGQKNGLTVNGTVAFGQGGPLPTNTPELGALLDGTTGYLTGGTPASIPASFEAWVNHNGVAWSASHEMIVVLGPANVTYLSVLNGALRLSLFLNGVQQTFIGPAVPTTGWHHVVATWDGTNVLFYLDGVATAAGSSSGALTVGPVYIGQFGNGSLWFNGSIARVTLYSTALTTARVLAHYRYSQAAPKVYTAAEAAVTANNVHVGWGQTMDVNACPSVALPWLAQFAGVVLPTGVTDANARTLITGQGNMKRGTVAAMSAAAAALLSGKQRVDIYERQGGAYLLKVVTYLVDTPGGSNGAVAASVLAAITAQKPAGLILSYVVQSGPTWNQMAGFPTPTAGRWIDETDTWSQLSNEDPVNP